MKFLKDVKETQTEFHNLESDELLRVIFIGPESGPFTEVVWVLKTTIPTKVNTKVAGETKASGKGFKDASGKDVRANSKVVITHTEQIVQAPTTIRSADPDKVARAMAFCEKMKVIE